MMMAIFIEPIVTYMKEEYLINDNTHLPSTYLLLATHWTPSIHQPRTKHENAVDFQLTLPN